MLAVGVLAGSDQHDPLSLEFPLIGELLLVLCRLGHCFGISLN